MFYVETLLGAFVSCEILGMCFASLVSRQYKLDIFSENNLVRYEIIDEDLLGCAIRCMQRTGCVGFVSVATVPCGLIGQRIGGGYGELTSIQLYVEMAPCPVHDGFIAVASALCFKPSYVELSWAASENQCLSYGARLIVLDTPEKLNLTHHYLRTEFGKVYEYWIGSWQRGSKSYWIDGSSIVEEKETTEDEINVHRKCVEISSDKPSHNGLVGNECETRLKYICQI